MGEGREGVILIFWRCFVYALDILFVILDGFSGIDDGSVAVLKLGIVVEGFANGLAFFDCGINAFEGFREAGFERGLSPCRFGSEGGELFVAGGFELGANLTEFGGVAVLGDPILLEAGEFGLGGEDVSVFSEGSSVDFDFHSFEVGIGGLDVLFLLCDKFSEFSHGTFWGKLLW